MANLRQMRLRELGTGGAVLVGLLTAPAQAQAQQGEVSEVIVTGSRVMRDGSQAPTPVTVVAAEQLAVAAPRNLAEGLMQLPSFRGSTSTNSGGLGNGGGNQAGSYLNLRGLGTARTLTLLDGRRVAPSSTNGATDINLLPQALVQRVDVVTGGASAAYGSDAVAGVVNFILDTDFAGLKGVAQTGISQQGDAASYRLGLSFGAPFAGGRGHLLLSGMQSQSDPIFDSKPARDWSGRGVGLLTFPGQTPTNLILTNVNQPNYTGGVILTGPLAGVKFLPGGVSSPFDFGGPRTSANQVGGDGTRNYITLASLLVVGSVFGRATYEVTDDLRVFAEASFAESHNRYQQSTNQNTTTTAFTIYSGNPYIPADIQGRMASAGVSSFPLTRASYDMPRVTGDILNDSLNLVAGFDYSLGAWNLDAYFEHGDNRARFNTEGNQIFERMYAAADAVVNPANGQIVCRIMLQPVTPSNQALIDRLQGCTPINLFGEGSPSAEAVDYVLGTAWYRFHTKQDVFEVNLKGAPFSTWAGEVALATGLGWRRLSVNQESDEISQQTKATSAQLRGMPAALSGQVGGFSFTNQQPLSGEYTIKEGYVEAVIPLAKDARLAESLELNAAARYTDYSTSGGVTTWKLGLNWQPVQDLRLRGTVSRDIRAPSLTELFQGNAQGQTTVRDIPRGGAQVSIFQSTQGNPNLDVETADTYTVGAVYQPAWLPGLTGTIDYYNISIEGAIGVLTAQQTVDNCALGSQQSCDLIARGPDGSIQRIFLPFLNLSSLKTNGVDIELGYRTSLSDIRDEWDGQLSVRALVGYLGKLETTVPGSKPLDRAGEIGTTTNANPRWQGALQVNYDRGPFSVFVQERYISGGRYNNQWTEGVDINDNSIPPRWYTDATVRYRFGKDERYEAFLTVNNLFDRDPPLVPNGTAANWIQTIQSTYDLVGRYYTTGLRFEF